VDATIERLRDKASLVRKEAIRLLVKFIETHPFWLDAKLDEDLFRRRLLAIEEELAKVGSSFHFDRISVFVYYLFIFDVRFSLLHRLSRCLSIDAYMCRLPCP
jgi:hypothetical protein